MLKKLLLRAATKDGWLALDNGVVTRDMGRVYGCTDVLPPHLRRAINEVKGRTPLQGLYAHLHSAAHLAAVRADCASEDERLRQTGSPQVKKARMSKNLASFSKLLRDAAALWDLGDQLDIDKIEAILREGVETCGMVKPAGFWRPLELEEALKGKVDREELWNSFKPLSKAWMCLDDCIEVATAADLLVKEGRWTASRPDWNTARGNGLPPSKAFAAHQSGKIRMCIDKRGESRARIPLEKVRYLGVKAAIAMAQLCLAEDDAAVPLMQDKADAREDVKDEQSLPRARAEQLLREVTDALAEDERDVSDVPKKKRKTPATAPKQRADATIDANVQSAVNGAMADASNEPAGPFLPSMAIKDLSAFYYQIPNRNAEENRVAVPLPSVEAALTVEQHREFMVFLAEKGLDKESWGRWRKPKGSEWRWRVQTAAWWARVGTEIPEQTKGAIVRWWASRGAIVNVPQKWAVFDSSVCVFGSLSSVWDCVTISESLVIIAIIGLKLVTTLYVDDWRTLERRLCLPAASAVQELMLTVAGFGMSYHKFKDSCAFSTLVDLGVEWSFRQSWIELKMPDVKCERALELIDSLTGDIDQRRLSQNSIEKARGLIRYVAFVSNAGAGVVRALDNWRNEDGFQRRVYQRAARNSLRKSLVLIRKMLTQLKPMALSKARVNRPVIHMCSDASLEAGAGWTGAIIFPVGGPPAGFKLQVENWGLHGCEANIAMLEMIAADAAQQTFANWTKGTQIVHHIDNVPDVCGLVRASSPCRTCQAVATRAAKRTLREDAAIYYAWISAHRNVSDACTRMEKVDALEKAFPDLVWLAIEWRDYQVESRTLDSVGL